MNPKDIDNSSFDYFRKIFLDNFSKKYDEEFLDDYESEYEPKRKIISKKDECISNMEDFIELMSALCPSEEELIRHKGNLLLEEIKKI